MQLHLLSIIFLASHSLASPLQADRLNDAASVPVIGKRNFKEDKITPTSVVGAPKRGSAFDDKDLIGTDHKRLQFIAFAGCEPGMHLTWMQVAYGHDGVATSGRYHGTVGDTITTHTLRLYYDRIIKVELVTWKKKVGFTYKTRVGHITLHTKNKMVAACGDKNPNDKVITWYTYGKSLLYFSGTQGDEIDSLKGHFIPSEDY